MRIMHTRQARLVAVWACVPAIRQDVKRGVRIRLLLFGGVNPPHTNISSSTCNSVGRARQHSGLYALVQIQLGTLVYYHLCGVVYRHTKNIGSFDGCGFESHRVTLDTAQTSPDDLVGGSKLIAYNSIGRVPCCGRYRFKSD